MAKTLITTRPYIFSSTKTNLFLNSFPLFSHFNKSFTSRATLLVIKSQPISSLFGSSDINKPIKNEENYSRVVVGNGFGALGRRRFSIKATHVNDRSTLSRWSPQENYYYYFLKIQETYCSLTSQSHFK